MTDAELGPESGSPARLQSIRVLAVGLGEESQAALRDAFRNMGDHSVETAADSDEAIDILESETVDCVISAYQLSEADGVSLLRTVRGREPELPFALLATDGTYQVLRDAIDAGVSAYIDSGDADYRERLQGFLEASLETRRRERRRDHETLRKLYQISSDRELSLGEKCSQMLNLGSERLGLPFGFVTEIDAEANRQRVVLSNADDPRLQPDEVCPLSEAYCRKTLERDSLLAVQNAPDEGWQDDPAYERFDLGAYIGAKVYVGDRIYGTLCFASHETRGEDFTDFDRTFVELMAEWVSYELERQKQSKDLQRQNERLEEFASIVSHDLRNPLSIVKGSIELLQGDDEQKSADIERALDAAIRMETLIDNMLTLARQGETVTEFETIDLAAVARESWSVVDTLSGALRVETAEYIRADESRLRQLLENLFGNAVEHGGDDVTVTVGTLTDSEGFYVEDDGPGIPADRREQVLERGYTQSESGSGYGLSIVTEIAEAHGWEIQVDEGEDSGARFEFRDIELAQKSDSSHG